MSGEADNMDTHTHFILTATVPWSVGWLSRAWQEMPQIQFGKWH